MNISSFKLISASLSHDTMSSLQSNALNFGVRGVDTQKYTKHYIRAAGPEISQANVLFSMLNRLLNFIKIGEGNVFNSTIRSPPRNKYYRNLDGFIHLFVVIPDEVHQQGQTNGTIRRIAIAIHDPGQCRGRTENSKTRLQQKSK